jgi:hypothetical protein
MSTSVDEPGNVCTRGMHAESGRLQMADRMTRLI